ncbi:MAG: hypothetical protein U0T84_08820 [Chitinophagales bacterium]
MKKIWLILSLVPTLLVAQEKEGGFNNIDQRQKTANNAVAFSAFYGAEFPVGVLQKRATFVSSIGAQFLYRMRHNWMIGAEGSFLYASKSKERPDTAIATHDGPHITQNGDLTDINPSINGFALYGFASKLFPFKKEKAPGTGIVVKLGVGFLQHKILYNINPQSLPQFDKNYRTGYDRMTNGAAISVFAGIMRMERHKYFNFYFGPQFDLAFTQNRRPWDFAEMRQISDKRIDMMVGIKFGLLVPVFLNKDSEVIYR